VTTPSPAPPPAVANAWLRRLVLLLVIVVLAVAVLAAWRALFPVSGLKVSVAGGVLRPGAEIWIDAVTSGPGPIHVRLDAEQQGRTELLASGRLATRHWSRLDLRPLRHSMRIRMQPDALTRLARGRLTLRATAVPPPAWPRRAPPVVSEKEVECEP
jgi:hypothetical protein